MLALLNKVLPERTFYGMLLIISLAAILYGKNMIFGRLIGGFFGNYVLPSVIWILLALLILFLYPRACPQARSRHKRLFCWAALLCALAGVAAIFATGMLQGFGKSPYDHSAYGVVSNIFHLGAMLVGMEVSRAWLVNSLFKKRPWLGIGFTALFFTLFAFSLGRLGSFEKSIDGIEFAGNIFLPSFFENLLASFLVFLSGPLPAIIYRGVLLIFHWFPPILPDLNWVTQALIGSFLPVFCIVLLSQVYRMEVQRIRSREKESPVGWVVASVISVLMIWFSVGVFSVYPNVIISGSMLPKIDIGDVVVVKSIEPEEVELDDVIQFREIEQDVRINHRVIDIQEDERGLPLFITKGDNNDSPDSEPVIAEQVMGKVIHIVPRVGWVTIALRSPGSG